MIKKISQFRTNQPFLFDFITALVTALLFSGFIYLEYYGISLKFLNTLFALSALTLLLYIPKRAVLIAGFFIGLLWFYWIGYSFKYNGVGWMSPLVSLGFGLVYMGIFGVLSFTNKVYIRAILLFGISFFAPFGFQWLQIELLFVESYIGIFKYQLLLVLLALSLPAYVKGRYKYTPLILILFAVNFNTPTTQLAPLKIKLVATDIKQDEKWLQSSKRGIIQENLLAIKKAINEGYDLVILPESTFPLYMNKYPNLTASLKKLSNKISIVAGALYMGEDGNFNVTYLFQNEEISIAKKMVLVPFGEYVPLPKFAQKFISDYFFAGQADFIHSEVATDFIIKGVKFRNAICYEATTQDIYEGDVKFVIATSNNAWFTPSIEPTLQNLLMRYYARKNGVTIYHASNSKGTGIIQ